MCVHNRKVQVHSPQSTVQPGVIIVPSQPNLHIPHTRGKIEICPLAATITVLQHASEFQCETIYQRESYSRREYPQKNLASSYKNKFKHNLAGCTKLNICFNILHIMALYVPTFDVIKVLIKYQEKYVFILELTNHMLKFYI